MTAVFGACVLVVFAWTLIPTMEGQVIRCWSTSVEPHVVMRQCYSDVCRCNNYTLDCSSTWGRLTYVPNVLDNVQVLNFSNNHLLTLPPAFFSNVSRTVWLIDLYNNDLTVIHPLAFSRLPKLNTLLIGGNVLNYSALAPVLAVPTLRTLDIKCGALGSPPARLFEHAHLANSLKHLDLSWNHIRSLNMAVLQPLRTLRNLSVWTNEMHELRTAYLPALIYVNFHNNLLSDFPVSCRASTRRTLFPNLKILHLDFNAITTIPDPVCLPRLKVLNLKSNRIVFIDTNMFSRLRFPALTHVEMVSMGKTINRILPFAFNNSALLKIGLGYNKLDFAGGVVHEDAFRGCSKLFILYLDHTDLQHVTEDRFVRLFGHLATLKTLYLGYCQIGLVSRPMFAIFPQLMRLYLYGNILQELPAGVFKGLRNLSVLILNNNRLPGLSAATLSTSTRHRSVSFLLFTNCVVSCRHVFDTITH